MNKRYFRIFGLLMVGVSLLLVVPVAAQGPQWNFVSIVDTSGCGTGSDAATVQLEWIGIEGNGTFYYDTIAESGGLVYMDEIFPSSSFPDGISFWGIYDSNDRGLQDASFADIPLGSTVNVTIRLHDSTEAVVDQDTFSFGCGTPIEPAVVPGCDATLAIPSGSVVGQFVADAPVLWEPDATATTGLTVTAGKTYWVTGQDASGQFRQIILQCKFVWVPFQAVGPNPDATWHNAPLPVTVIK